MDSLTQEQQDQMMILELKAEVYDAQTNYRQLLNQYAQFAKAIADELGLQPDQSGVLKTEAVLNAIQQLKMDKG